MQKKKSSHKNYAAFLICVCAVVFLSWLTAGLVEIQQESEKNDGIVIAIALNYGGRSEIIHATKEIAKRLQSGAISESDITEEYFDNYLYTSGMPDVDMIIRPSGEMRTSNFLIWQGAYAELVFMDVLWPDFSEKDLVCN